MNHLEAFHETSVFGPHRWMIRGSDNRIISGVQFTSKHDAEAAIKVAMAAGELAKEELADRLRDILP